MRKIPKQLKILLLGLFVGLLYPIILQISSTLGKSSAEDFLNETKIVLSKKNLIDSLNEKQLIEIELYKIHNKIDSYYFIFTPWMSYYTSKGVALMKTKNDKP